MFENILNTIVNDDITVYDENKPYSFIEFAQFYTFNVKTSSIIQEYNEYIQQWYIVKNNQISDTIINSQIQKQYIQLLKEITLNYTSVEEQRFLSSLQITNDILNDEYELKKILDIIIPFYVTKINNVCKYFILKRHEYKQNFRNIKSISSPKSLKSTIKSIILDELKNNIQDYKSLNEDYVTNNLPKILEVDIEDLYDNTDYYNEFSLSSINNNNEIAYNEFYDWDKSVINAIREFPFYLVSSNIFNFSVNPELNSNDIQYLPNNKFIEYNKTTNNNDIILSLQKELSQKFSGVDYYYISTDLNTNITSGLLFQADDSIFNILNINILNTPFIQNEDDQYNIRSIGSNFKPDKFGLLYYDVNTCTYNIDTSKLSANCLYVFPDPEKFGKKDIPLIWHVDVSQQMKNESSQFAKGYPQSNCLSQHFYPYFSSEQKQQILNLQKNDFKNNFENIDGGFIIATYKQDIYGNEYALFKKDLFSVTSQNKQINDNEYINLVLDGKNINENVPVYTSLYSTSY